MLIWLRRAVLLLILLTVLTGLVMVAGGKLAFYDCSSREGLAVLATTVTQTSAAIGAIALALVFVTAQLSVGTPRPLAVRLLYRQPEIYLLVVNFIATILLGYSVLLRPLTMSCTWVNILLILGAAQVIGVLPLVLFQIENLDPVALGRKLAQSIRPKSIERYGLTRVVMKKTEHGVYVCSLNLVGLRPPQVDPLRPIHEVIMEAVRARDRVLLGKLLAFLLSRIAHVHGVAWRQTGGTNRRAAVADRFWLMGAARFSPPARLHCTLALLHYTVKRVRNLLFEWEERDIGRHGALTAIADLIWSLSHSRRSEVAIEISLYAVLRISEEYRNVVPYGRVEPLNLYFAVGNRLLRVGYGDAARLCASILAWAATRTAQLNKTRMGSEKKTLAEELKKSYNTARRVSARHPGWLPGKRSEDPWRDWLRSS